MRKFNFSIYLSDTEASYWVIKWHISHDVVCKDPTLCFALQTQWKAPEAQLFQSSLHLVGNRGARGEKTQKKEAAALLCNRGVCRELEEHWKTPCPGGGTVSTAVCSILFPNPSSHTMAAEAAIEALRATADLVSQTKMGQLFKLLDLLSYLQVLFLLFFFK